jgi:CTD small phosphatase-like protein 2
MDFLDDLTVTTRTAVNPAKAADSCLSRSPLQIMISPRPHTTGHGLKHLLVLDLDETLVHGVFTLKDRCDVVVRNVIATLNGPPQMCYVKYRPHLQEFLQQMSQMFEVCVFTASTQAYADAVLDRIDPQKVLIQHRLYRQHCVLHDEHKYLVKDLSRLGRDLKKVVLADNNPECFAYQPHNGLQVPTWTGDVKDTALRDLVPWLQKLARSDEVYPVVAEYSKAMMAISSLQARK